MTTTLQNPRSTLHALQPMGVATPEVESLLSYTCRLAVSHSVSVAALSRKIAEAFGWQYSNKREWHRVKLNGTGEVAMDWAGALSALTGVEGLNKLTLSPWRQVVSQPGLSAKRACWCSKCFVDDKAAGKAPYFRLAWDVGAVQACPKHHIRLTDVCSSCGRSDARHKSAFVVPGWCAHCGSCLDSAPQEPASPEEIWVATQVGTLLEAQCRLELLPAANDLHLALNELVVQLDHGRAAHFARRIGVSKVTTHHWLNEGGLPTMNALLSVAGHAGISLHKLMTGDLTDWVPPLVAQETLFRFQRPNRETPRQLDWPAIRRALTTLSQQMPPISVSEAASSLAIDPRQLYAKANLEARQLGRRWQEYMRQRGQEGDTLGRDAIAAACRSIVADGRAITLRELDGRVPHAVLNRTRSVITVLQETKESLAVLAFSNHSTLS